MPCVDDGRAARWRGCSMACLMACLLAGGCSGPTTTTATPPAAGAGAAPAKPTPGAPAKPAPSPPPAAAAPSGGAARNWDEYRLAAAQRIVAANRGASYDGPVPAVLLAIPVLEIELNGDGSVQRINVLRHPKQAQDTVPLAVEAVRRAAPFGSVRHLPRPWKFNEVFLFDDARRFKLRSHDQ